MKKIIAVMLIIALMLLVGCANEPIKTDVSRQNEVTYKLSESQQTPTDIDYSLERYNLIRRAYWVNGQREKANALPCELVKPLGYIVLISSNTVLNRFAVDGKVSSLNSYLTPNYQEKYYREGAVINTELADVDGSYGENDSGIFFFTPDGNYIEWTGQYLYSDIPMTIENPVISYEVK